MDEGEKEFSLQDKGEAKVQIGRTVQEEAPIR